MAYDPKEGRDYHGRWSGTGNAGSPARATSAEAAKSAQAAHAAGVVSRSTSAADREENKPSPRHAVEEHYRGPNPGNKSMIVTSTNRDRYGKLNSISVYNHSTGKTVTVRENKSGHRSITST